MLKIQLATVPLVLTFQSALTALRNEVTQHKKSSTGGRFARARQQRQISEVTQPGRAKTRTDSSWEKLTNGEVIEYHPSFRFGKKLNLFPPELRQKLDKQRQEYKQKRGRSNSNNKNSPSKRQIKKARTEIRQLAELVDLTRSSPDKNSINANPMGGRNERHQQRQQNSNEIDSKIAELKTSLGISTLRIQQTSTKPQQHQNWECPPGTVANNECDTNADCGVAGKNMIPLEFTTRSADVTGFSNDLGTMKDIPIVTAATAYTCTNTGQVFILVFHEFLWYGGRMDHSLINPNQLRSYGVPVWDNPFDTSHPTQIEINDSIVIPLAGVGTKLSFKTRVPSRTELRDCPHITMTSPLPWDPKNIRISTTRSCECWHPKIL